MLFCALLSDGSAQRDIIHFLIVSSVVRGNSASQGGPEEQGTQCNGCIIDAQSHGMCPLSPLSELNLLFKPSLF